MSPIPHVSRRAVLGGAVAAGAASLLPPSVHRAMAMPPRHGGLRAIEHVIVLMQENRAFDHYYGTLRGVRGFGDAHPLRRADGTDVFAQADGKGGHVLPYSARTAAQAAGRPAGDVEYLDALPHTWPDATQAAHEGRWDQWVPAKTASTMAHVDRRDAAFQYELADTFTICDAYHCSMHGGTNPNRNYLWSGTTGYEPGTRKRALLNDAYDYDHPGYEWTCYPERLAAAGVDWRIYQEWDNYTDNAVEYFRTFKDVGTKVLRSVTTKTYRTTEELYDSLPDLDAATREKTLAQLEQGRATLSPKERELFDRALHRSAPGTLMARIEADIAAHRLPAVTWIVPPAKDSEHPSVSGAIAGANLTYRLLDAIASDADTWQSTALFLNFDENDGYFDHVPSPQQPRPAGDTDDWYDGHPVGLGPRVPMTVVSPWTVGGVACSEVFDHTSVLRFLERWTGVAEPNISAWRRTVAGDLVGAFDFHRSHPVPKVAAPPSVPAATKRWHPTAPAQGRMPAQEPGARPARPLPYSVAVRANPDDRGLELELVNVGRASAHFAIHSLRGDAEPVHADVRGTQRVRVDAPGGVYGVSVQGPNRYWADIEGTLTGAAAAVEVDVAPRPHGRRARVTVANSGATDATVRLVGELYGGRARLVDVPAGGRRVLEWPTEEGWFDLHATCSDDPSWRRRFVGRLENGHPGVTG